MKSKMAINHIDECIKDEVAKHYALQAVYLAEANMIKRATEKFYESIYQLPLDPDLTEKMKADFKQKLEEE